MRREDNDFHLGFNEFVVAICITFILSTGYVLYGHIQHVMRPVYTGDIWYKTYDTGNPFNEKINFYEIIDVKEDWVKYEIDGEIKSEERSDFVIWKYRFRKKEELNKKR